VLAPWLEPSFHPRSFGYRPKRGPFHALATALHLADSSRRYTLLTADLQNAFGTVSVQRLLGLVGVRFGDAVRSLVQMLIGHRRRGLSQGAPLSPVLLNLFADHFVDWPWQRDCPGVPLFRYADDVLALCENVSEAQDCERRLRQLLRPAGLQIKHESKAIVDVQRGAASWLGYEIHRQGSAWAIDVRPLAWATLESLLVEAQINPNSVTRCSEVIWGWLDSLGPAYAQPKVKSTAERIAAIAERCGFEEPPSTRKIRERWRRAWRRWKTVLSQTKSDWRHDRLDTESMMNPKF
jgi:AraC-like DNA-binding protein